MTNYRKKLLWLYARKRGSGSGGISVSVSGTTPITLANAIESAIRHMTQFGKVTQSGTPTTANPVDIVCNNGALKWDSENQRIYADGTPEVLTVSADDAEDQTATVENLLAVGNVRDEQDIITGKVIRRTEVFRYDGTQTVKPTYLSSTGGKDDGAIIVQPRGAEYAGDVVSFEAEEGENIDSLSVTLQPTQDLHGYDAPWPAGGGVNKLPAMVDGTYEGNGVKAVVKDGVATFSGTTTASGNAFIIPLTEEVTASDSFYYHCLNSEANASLAPTIENSSDTTQNVSLSLSPANRISGNYTNKGGQTYNRIRFYIGNGVTISGTYAPMFCADNTARSYQPYSNSCPITGTDKAEVVRTGVNVWDEEWEVGAYNANGTKSQVTDRIRSKNPIPVLPNTTYYFKTGSTAQFMTKLFFDKDMNPLQTAPSQYQGNSNSPFTTPNNARYMLWYGTSTYGTTYNHDISINYPATDTAYHAYDPLSTTMEVEWGADVGTIYGGRVDAVRGEVVIDHIKAGLIATGKSAGDDGFFYTTSTNLGTPPIAGLNAGLIADRFKVISNVTNGNKAEITFFANGIIRWGDPAYIDKTWQEYNTAHANERPQIVYQIREPITLPLSPQTLKALRNNTVWSDAGAVDVLLSDELVEMVAKQPLKTAEGDNTVSVVSEVGEVELAVTYKGGSE